MLVIKHQRGLTLTVQGVLQGVDLGLEGVVLLHLAL